jgi:PhzF family phenazine biosynthesis protein
LSGQQTILQRNRNEINLMPRIPCWQVDAFTDRPFAGNPAAVCWLEQEADPAWMQAVAAEMNLAETAFARPLGDLLELRWFTPMVEVDLCGHATLATAHALWWAGVVRADGPLRFQTRSGVLTCQRSGGFIELDFPALPVSAVEPRAELLAALGVESPRFVGRSKFDEFVVLDSVAAVRNVRPDFRKLGPITSRGVIVTARSDDPRYDFQSRFFAPAVGIDEDPVCGSAHCSLTPYWAEQLGKQELNAYQTSARGGVLRLKDHGDRVTLGGQAVTVWQGELV